MTTSRLPRNLDISTTSEMTLNVDRVKKGQQMHANPPTKYLTHEGPVTACEVLNGKETGRDE